jgi:hypothetical protein
LPFATREKTAAPLRALGKPIADVVGPQPIADVVGPQPIADVVGPQPIADVVGPQPIAGWQQAFDPLLTPGARNYWKSHDFVELSDPAIELIHEPSR